MGLWDLFQQGQINGLDDQVRALVEQVTRLSEANLELTRQVKDLSERVAELERAQLGRRGPRPRRQENSCDHLHVHGADLAAAAHG